MKKERLLALALGGAMLCTLAACGGETEPEATPTPEAVETRTGKGQGFGGVITAQVTLTDGVITAVTFDGPEETEAIGGAALEELAGQVVAANGAEIDGVSGATYTTDGCKAAVLNALDPVANPFEEKTAEPESWPTGDEPVDIPAGRNIVSATTYGIYTKAPDSAQDAVIKATLYWDLDSDSCYAIRFTEPLTPWLDTGATDGWGCVTDEALLAKLGDSVVDFTAEATAYSPAVEVQFAKYIQIGGQVWSGEAGATANQPKAVVYSAQIDGQTVTLFDYCATEAGGKEYVEAALAGETYLLTEATPASSAGDPQVAAAVTVPTKENSGHGVGFWSSPITFPGNIELLKQFAQEENFAYGYYADGGLSQNEEGYWQTPDAVSGATIEEGCTYLDMLKTLRDRIAAGEYTVEQ